MKNHIWSVIARRMKHNHTSWSRSGGNHLAKILAKKCSGKLYEVTEKLKRPVFEEEIIEKLYEEILSSSKAPKKDGKGYEYPAIGHMVGLEGKSTGRQEKASGNGWILSAKTKVNVNGVLYKKSVWKKVANDYLTVTKSGKAHFSGSLWSQVASLAQGSPGAGSSFFTAP